MKINIAHNFLSYFERKYVFDFLFSYNWKIVYKNLMQKQIINKLSSKKRNQMKYEAKSFCKSTEIILESRKKLSLISIQHLI